MSPQEKYNMKWHTYPDHLKEMLHNMRTSDNFTDVTLVCDDQKEIKAHKVVLSACSSVFNSIFTQHNLPLIYLRGIQHVEMESILQFIYLGQTSFYQERIKEFLKVAKDLDIKLLNKDVEYQESTTQVIDKEKNEYEEQEASSMEVNISNNQNDEIGDTLDKDMMNNSSEEATEHRENNLEDFEVGKFVCKLTCNLCNAKFNIRKTLQSHIQSAHEGLRYKCNPCDKMYTSNSTLWSHIKAVHEGVKYECQQCGNKFTRSSSLNFHIRTMHSQ